MKIIAHQIIATIFSPFEQVISKQNVDKGEMQQIQILKLKSNESFQELIKCSLWRAFYSFLYIKGPVLIG